MDEIAKLIEDLYAVEHILSALQKKPNEYAGVSLYANETHTLKLIADNEGISQAEVSERMYRTKGATSVMVDKLVKKGLVNREREEGNQRRYLLTLTEKGWTVNGAHREYDDNHAAWVTRNLDISEEDLQTTRKTLDDVIGFYSRHYLKEGKAVVPDREESGRGQQ
ncbi:MAG: MarR family transcriptional regulator [Lachnospiraceae bacterium]|nr:MarR family transcriptional regulator [Lachnospiraceae bacterium]